MKTTASFLRQDPALRDVDVKLRDARDARRRMTIETQVLERLVQEGMASRAEITAAAMGERAECVMLNKGPYILEAVRTLDSILTRMQAHQR